jgi:hypothetical protein
MHSLYLVLAWMNILSKFCIVHYCTHRKHLTHASYLPNSNLWNNLELKGKAFEDRSKFCIVQLLLFIIRISHILHTFQIACCLVGTNEASDQCPKLDEIETFGLSQKQIFALIIVPLLVIELCGCYFCFIRKRMKDDEHERH